MKTKSLISATVLATFVALWLSVTPQPARAKTSISVGLGYSDAGGTFIGLGYGYHGGHNSFAVNLGYGGYYSYAPGYSYYSYPPAYYSPGYSSFYGSYYSGHHSDSHHHGGRSGYAVRYSYYGGYPYYYRPAPAYYAPPAYYGAAPAVVAGSYGYYGGHSSVGVGVAVPITYASRPPRPSSTNRIVYGSPVENNPILKRVWVPGYYETPNQKSGATSSNQTASNPSDRVWIPGHYEYIPDTQ